MGSSRKESRKARSVSGVTGGWRGHRSSWAKVYTATLILTLCVALSGCWDEQKIEKQISVAALGIDTHKSDLQVTIQVPIPVKIAGSGGDGGGGGQEAVQFFVGNGKDLDDALRNIQKQLDESLTLGHLRLIVFSQEIAERGLAPVIDGLRRNHEIRRELWPIVSKGKASDLLHANPKLEPIPAVYLMDMFESHSQRGSIFDRKLIHLLNDLSDHSKQPMLNYIAHTDKTVNWAGTALFNKTHMVSSLNEVESRLLLQLGDGNRGSHISVPCPNDRKGIITVDPRKVRRKVTFDEAAFKFRIAIRIDGVIEEKTCALDLAQQKHIALVEKKLKQQYEAGATRLVRKLQQQRIDVLKLGLMLRAFYPDVWERIDWQKAFPKAAIDVAYTVRIRGRGAEYN